MSIEDVEMQDSGIYSCRVRTSHGEVITSCCVTITESCILNGTVDDDLVDDDVIEAQEEVVQESVPEVVPLTPEFTKPLENIKLNENTELKLSTCISNMHEPSFTWEKNGNPLSASFKLKLEHSGNEATLSIRRAMGDDAGTYKCTATGADGSSVSCECNVEMDKKASRPLFKKKVTNTNVVEGKALEVQVTVDGVPAPEVR